MKNILILFLFFIAAKSSASSLEAGVKNFCEKYQSIRKNGLEAIENNGRFLVKRKRAGDRFPRYTKVRFRGCRPDTEWMQEIYNTACVDESISLNQKISALNAIDIPEYFMFFFDGAGDFNASLAKKLLNPVNIDGSEGKDLEMGNANGLWALLRMFRHRSHALSYQEDSVELHYHAGSGFHSRENYRSALKCTEQIKENIDFVKALGAKPKHQPKWIAMGFSNGGALTIDYQNDVTEMGLKVDLAIAIDPIVQTLSYPFHGVKEMIGKRNPSTKRFINFYQNSDFGSMPVLELRGKPVEAADINLLLEAEEVPELNPEGKQNHLKINQAEVLFELSSCEFDKLFATRFHSKNCSKQFESPDVGDF